MRSFVGLFGVGLMIAAIAAHFSFQEQVPWLYIAISSIIYAGLVIYYKMRIEEKGENKMVNRSIWSANIAYILIALVTFLVNDLLTGVLIFIVSVALGIIIAFSLF